MTTRLYYTEPYRTTFDATVVACSTTEGRVEVVLDQTAFYPTSGGQPYDVGTLGGVAVHDVVDRDDGAIVHVVSGPLEPGAAVSGEIEWPRRFDHMQQHTGQHVLSAAFDHLFGVRTESFHLGAASASIDLAREVSPEQIRAAEDEANRIVWEDRPVTIRFASAEEAAAMPLRKESARTGPLRLIEVEGFDLSACGGTHVARSGAIGVIAAAGWEKVRGGTRVEFLCGVRALARFRQWRDALAGTMRLLSVQPEDLPAAIERLQLDARSQQKVIRSQQEQLATHEAQRLVSRAETRDGRSMVVETVEGWDASGLKALAVAVTASAPETTAVLASATPPLVVVSAGAQSGVDASAVLKALTARFGGKGGGRRELAQGGGFTAPVNEVLEAARTTVADTRA